MHSENVSTIKSLHGGTHFTAAICYNLVSCWQVGQLASSWESECVDFIISCAPCAAKFEFLRRIGGAIFFLSVLERRESAHARRERERRANCWCVSVLLG